MKDSFNWNKLNHLQLGKYAEYFVKMNFVLHGFDVYSSEVDDRGIDFVVRKDDHTFYDVQVKSVRNLNYIFFRKEYFKPRENLLAAIVLFNQNEEPNLYLVPSVLWQSPNDLFVSRDYEGKKSQPEWGLNLCTKNLPLLGEYSFDKTVASI